MDLEILKAYIEINLITRFIRPSKFPIGASILFVNNPDGSIWLYVDYQSLNNVTIENWYCLLLINKSLNWVNQAKHFNYLNLTNTYHQIWIRKGDK